MEKSNGSKFQLKDFSPKPVTLEIQDEDGNLKDRVRLRRFDLMAQIWVEETFESWESFEKLLESKKTSEVWKTVLKTVHYLLEDEHKERYPTWELFGRNFANANELLGLQKALMVVMGASAPLIDKVQDEVKKKVTQEMDRIGQK